MALKSTAAHYARMLICQNATIFSEIPTFLCPVLSRARQNASTYGKCPSSRRQFSQRYQRLIASVTPDAVPSESYAQDTRLPLQCSGCGALSQTVNKDEAGYYSLSRRNVRAFMGNLDEKSSQRQKEEEVVQEALRKVGGDVAETLRRDVVDRSGSLNTSYFINHSDQSLKTYLAPSLLYVIAVTDYFTTAQERQFNILLLIRYRRRYSSLRTNIITFIMSSTPQTFQCP